MLRFSLGFLLPFAAAVLTGSPPAVFAIAGLLGTSVLVARARLRTAAIPCIAGLLLVLCRSHRFDGEGQTVRSAGTALPVGIAGTVSGPCRNVHGMLHIPLFEAPDLRLASSLPGPLPGARIVARGRLEGHGRFVLLPGRSAVRVVAAPPPGHLPAVLESARRAFRRRLQQGLSPEASAHLATLLLGDRSLQARQRERLARSGLLHLFAVSGLHLAILAAVLRRGLGPWPVVVLPMLLLYAGLTGFRSPVGRAVLLEAGGLLGVALGRRTPRGAHLLLALVLLLAWDPGAWRGVGLRLSFCSYAGIQLLARPVLERARADPLAPLESGTRRRLASLVLAPLLVSTAAFLGALPVVACSFHRLAWAAIPGSLLLGPAVPLLLVAGIVQMVVPGWPPALLLIELTVRVLQLGLGVLELLPASPLDVARPHAAWCIVWCLSIAWAARRVHRAAGLRPPLLLLSALLVLLPLAPARERGVTLLRAGRGFAALAAGDRGTWLLDCGPAQLRVADQVLDLGVRRLDGVVLSHLDSDHAGGLPAIQDRLVVERLYSPEHAPRRAGPGDWSALEWSRGDLRLRVHWPPGRPRDAGRNDGSLAVILDLRTRRLVSLGDLESAGLGDLLEQRPLPPADVLVAPHHGARNRRLLDCLLQARPARIWIPARAGFPDESTMLTLLWSRIPWQAGWSRGESIRMR